MITIDNIRIKYPDRIPVIVKQYKDCTLPELKKQKYLVPKYMKINGFVYVIRRKIEITSEKALFITINGELCPSNSTLEEIYNKHQNEDGYLYIDYSGEHTFG